MPADLKQGALSVQLSSSSLLSSEEGRYRTKAIERRSNTTTLFPSIDQHSGVKVPIPKGRVACCAARRGNEILTINL